jgi:hypothetical protein
MGLANFQSKVNTVQAPGVAGDFASMNPFSSVLAGPGALVAPAGGLTVGNFAWVNPATLAVQQGYTSGYQIGFLGRNEQALITTFLDGYTLTVPEGFMVNLFNGGDFYAYFANGATSGSQVYADETTGAPQMNATNVVTGEIGWVGTAALSSVTGNLTIATITSGILSIGDTVSGTGITSGTTITGLVSGTANTVGAVYSLSVAPTTESAEAVTSTSTVLNVTAVADGGLSVGDTITGTDVSSGTVIVSYGTGSGGIGTYNVLVNGVATQQSTSGPQTISGPSNIATGFYVRGKTLVGAGVAKISANVA